MNDPQDGPGGGDPQQSPKPAAAGQRPSSQPVTGVMSSGGVMVGNSPAPGVSVQDWTNVPGVQAVAPATQRNAPKPSAASVMKVTSAFLYVKSIERSIEFYREALGATVSQKHAQEDGGPATLAIMRLGDFSMMLHIADDNDPDMADARPGVGIHLQLRVADVDSAYAKACNAGYYSKVSDGPIDQEWGWREFAIKDPDGYIWSVYQDKSGGAWT